MELKNLFVQDTEGNILGEATCYLYMRGTEHLVAGLLKANGTPLINPFDIGIDGLVQFSAPDGLYDLRVVKGARDYRLRLQFNDVAESVEAAKNAVIRAETAADASVILSGVKYDIADGLATTPEGGKFVAFSPSSDKYVIRYRVENGVPIEENSFPGSAPIQEVLDTVAIGFETSEIGEQGLVYAVVDSEGRRALAIKGDGTLLAKLDVKGTNGIRVERNPDESYTFKFDAPERVVPVGAAQVDNNFDSADYVYAVVDSQGRMLFGIRNDGTLEGKFPFDNAEVLAARGARNTLAERLSQGLSAYGLPRRHMWGEWYLRETRQRLRKRLLGEAAQLVVASIGDSWTHARARWSGPTSETLKTAYGDAGPGWVGLAWGFGGASSAWAGGNGSASALATVALSADWSVAYYTTASPDLGSISSSTVGAKATIGYTGTTALSAALLHYIGTAGQVRYRWNGGAWTTLTLSGTGHRTTALAGMPAVAFSLEIEVLEGTVTLAGIDLQATASGVRWHKLGATGSNAGHWTGVDSAQWQASLQALTPHLVAILLATNDQPLGPVLFRLRVQAMIDQVKAALPLADVLLIAPCENGRANTYPMADFAAAMYELAAINKCAFLDLQYVFGDSFSEYASTSPRAWFNADLIHPEPLSGGRVIADAVYRMLTQS